MQTAKYKSAKSQLASGMDKERWGKINVRGDVIQKIAQELQDWGGKDCNRIHPSGCHLHHMCQWLPLEFRSSQPARTIQRPCHF